MQSLFPSDKRASAMTAVRDSLVVMVRAHRAPGHPVLPLGWRPAADDDAGHGPLPVPQPCSHAPSRVVLLVTVVSALLRLGRGRQE